MEGPELKMEEPKTENRIILSMEEDAPNQEVGNLEMDTLCPRINEEAYL